MNVFRERNFAIYSAGNTISWLGMWMQRLAIGWLSWDLSHSPLWVGLISLAQYVPLIFAGPLFGVLLDHSDRRRYALAVNLVLMVLAFGLYAAAALDILSIGHLFAVCCMLGVANSAYQPVRLAMVSDIVPRTMLTQAIGVNSMIFNTTRLVGPALGGVVIAALGVKGAFIINALTYAAVLVSLAMLHLPPSAHRTGGVDLVGHLLEGIRYSVGRRDIREVLMLSAISSLLARGGLEMLPAFADGVFRHGSSGLAALTAATGAGALAAGLVLSRSSSQHHLRVLTWWSAIGSGLLLTAFALVPSYWAAVAIVAVLGTLVTLCSVGLQAVLQSTLDDTYRGRLVGLWGMVNVAGPSVGGALIGACSRYLQLPTVAAASGLLCAALSAIAMRSSSKADART
jgi:predicted MFS family arabinose efflux permease